MAYYRVQKTHDRLSQTTDGGQNVGRLFTMWELALLSVFKIMIKRGNQHLPVAYDGRSVVVSRQRRTERGAPEDKEEAGGGPPQETTDNGDRPGGKGQRNNKELPCGISKNSTDVGCQPPPWPKKRARRKPHTDDWLVLT